MDPIRLEAQADDRHTLSPLPRAQQPVAFMGQPVMVTGIEVGVMDLARLLIRLWFASLLAGVVAGATLGLAFGLFVLVFGRPHF